MENILRITTALAKTVCEAYLGPDAVAVDATCGNGHDTLWLAQRCRKVYAFDVQPEAVSATCARLREHGFDHAEVICDSHEALLQYVDTPVDLVLFNLGYLPGGDKQITTCGETTLAALNAALSLLKVNGLISVVLYWGHPEGKKEREAVLHWAASLDPGQYHCVRTDMLNQGNCPPEVLWITRKR